MKHLAMKELENQPIFIFVFFLSFIASKLPLLFLCFNNLCEF